MNSNKIKSRHKFKGIIISMFFLLLICFIFLFYLKFKTNKVTPNDPQDNALSSQESVSEITTHNRIKVDETDGKTYISGILIVNKKYSLPETYNPGTDQTAVDAFNKMMEDASLEGINIWIASGFRSYEDQKEIHCEYVNCYGNNVANTFSAEPGHSEHQTGLAFDLNSIDDSFAETDECNWVANNCYKYGFIIRYPKNKEHITGYKYEPWHIRYLGIKNATNVYNSRCCLEEYLGII